MRRGVFSLTNPSRNTTQFKMWAPQIAQIEEKLRAQESAQSPKTTQRFALGGFRFKNQGSVLEKIFRGHVMKVRPS